MRLRSVAKSDLRPTGLHKESLVWLCCTEHTVSDDLVGSALSTYIADTFAEVLVEALRTVSEREGGVSANEIGELTMAGLAERGIVLMECPNDHG